MAAEEEEPILTHPGSPENAVHVHDYERFTRLFKYGAIVCLIIAVVWLLIVKAYW
jgi:di/tricarboxylate transporter